jgi:hypothetical protein
VQRTIKTRFSDHVKAFSDEFPDHRKAFSDAQISFSDHVNPTSGEMNQGVGLCDMSVTAMDLDTYRSS